ncbi:MAG: hypothetical protein HYX79_05355 [Chloroflexi bacterium]|nr:hypothetical protein [Chloroflexota bacterium]
MKVTIIDDSIANKCEGHCGTDWSSAESRDLAARRIEERFGGGIDLEYVDLSSPMPTNHALKFKKMAGHEKIPLPLLLLDGQPKISGQFDMRQLLDAIETELEVRHE